MLSSVGLSVIGCFSHKRKKDKETSAIADIPYYFALTGLLFGTQRFPGAFRPAELF